ncbi:MAG: hypothetical protein IJL98_10180 [Lachnospiraceae bacterium]|nr:hypothetical protein [Lachnospiraceae bacterium]
MEKLSPKVTDEASSGCCAAPFPKGETSSGCCAATFPKGEGVVWYVF